MEGRTGQGRGGHRLRTGLGTGGMIDDGGDENRNVGIFVVLMVLMGLIGVVRRRRTGRRRRRIVLQCSSPASTIPLGAIATCEN